MIMENKIIGISRRRSAFTLIEIMVASVIMVILTGLVIQITSEVLKVWNRSSGKLSANAEVRIALEFLTQDLETAVLRNNGKQWFRVEAPIDPGGPYTDQTVALKLFSPALDRDKSVSGDICAVGYQLDFGPAYEGAEDNVYALYRKIVNPEVTFNSVMGSSGDSLQDSLVGGQWDSIVDKPERANYLAGNILEFKVFLCTDDGTGADNFINVKDKDKEDPDMKLDGIDYAFGINPSNPDTTVVEITDQLLYAEVHLKVISDEGLQLLQRFDEQGAFDRYKAASDIVIEHGQTFTRRVNFLARPL